jgi:hypothetical protein
VYIREVRGRRDIEEEILQRSRWEKDVKRDFTETESEGID